MKKRILERYTRNAEGIITIDITAGKVEDLYSNFDRYTPYTKKELDQDLVEYIVECVREIGKEPFVIHFRLTATPEDDLMIRVRKSVRNYFLYLKDLEFRKLAGMARASFILLSIGLSLLFISVWIDQKSGGGKGVLMNFMAEGLTVAAWVSLWNALANFLINWVPHRRQIKKYERISKAPILFQ